MRFKPGTTNEEAKAKLAAFAEKQRNGGMNPGPMPEPPRTPIKNVSPQRPVLPPRPSTQSVRPGVSPPQQPNVMGFPDMDPRMQQLAGQLGQQVKQQMFGRPTSMPPTQGPRIQQAVVQDPMGSQQAAQQAAGAALQGFAKKAGSFFKKGGAVTTKAKAPMKKAAGGKVAAKAPVKKAMGGPIKAKPMAKGRKR